MPTTAGTTASANLLVLAGGGGGGGGGSTYANGGGGGAGGLIYLSAYTITVGASYTVSVGTGGTGGLNDYTNCTGKNGGNSVFNDQTAVGGAGAAGWSGVAPTNGGNGAGGPGYTTMGSSFGTTGTTGQGNYGGAGDGPSYTGSNGSAGGGGGAGSAGGNYSGGGVIGGAGGAAVNYNITGATVSYAGGGGGGGSTTGGAGGTGGGNGGSGNVNGTNATANTGGGGGGAGAAGSGGGTYGGNGGSGTVVISFLTSSVPSYTATGTYTATVVGSNTVVQWTSGTGTITFNSFYTTTQYAAQLNPISGTYVQYMSTPNFTGNPTAFSVSAWVYLLYTQAGRTYFSNYSSAGTGWVVGIDDSTNNLIKFYAGSATFNSSVTLSNFTWYHVVLTYDASASPKMNLYINNNTPETSNLSLTYSGTAVNNVIGQLTAGSNNQSFAANMTSLGYWTRAITSTEVSYLYNSGDPLLYSYMTGSVLTNLVSWYDLSEATGTTRVDSVSGNNMTDTTSIARVAR